VYTSPWGRRPRPAENAGAESRERLGLGLRRAPFSAASSSRPASSRVRPSPASLLPGSRIGLEVGTATGLQLVRVRYGTLRRLPADYKGERHVIVSSQLPNQNGHEWVEFEEVPGPHPNPPQQPAQRGSLPIHIDVHFVAPYPRPEPTP